MPFTSFHQVCDRFTSKQYVFITCPVLILTAGVGLPVILWHRHL